MSLNDNDQGGITRQLVRIFLGPSVGWVETPRNGILDITEAGNYTVPLGITLIRVNVAGLVGIHLPSALGSPAGAALPGTFVGTPITVVDTGGNAGGFPISLIPFGSETISGLGLAQISASYGAAVITPDTPNANWTLITASATQALQPIQWYQTRAFAQASFIAPSNTFIAVVGLNAIDDGGAGLYKKVPSNPGGGGFQSADGAWWQLFSNSALINIKQSAVVDPATDLVMGISNGSVCGGLGTLFSVESFQNLPLIVDTLGIVNGAGNNLNGPLFYDNNLAFSETTIYYGNNASRIGLIGSDDSVVYESVSGNLVVNNRQSTGFTQVSAVGNINDIRRGVTMGYAGTATGAFLTQFIASYVGEQAYLGVFNPVPITIYTSNRSRLFIDSSGSWGSAYNGTGLVSTVDPNGYFFAPASAGAPTAVPNAINNGIPIVIDFGSVATGKLWAYINGNWRFINFT